MPGGDILRVLLALLPFPQPSFASSSLFPCVATAGRVLRCYLLSSHSHPTPHRVLAAATNNWDERTRGPAQPPGSVSSSSQGGQTTPKPSNLDALRNYYGQPDAAANPDTDVPRAMRRSGSAKTVPDRALFANLERFPGPPDARSGRSSDSEDAAQLVNTPSRRRQGSRPESHVSDIVFGGTVADLTRPSGRLRVSESLCGYHDVAFILTASQAYLRIYSPVTVLHGNHATLRKAFLPEPIESAYAFAALHGPAVACLSPAASLHVYALPNLSRLHKVPLQPHVGPAWRAPDGAVPAGAAAKASCFSRDGAQGAVVTVAGDVVRFGLTAASAPPPPALAPAAPAGVQAGPRRTAAPLDTAFSFLRVEPGAERHSGADPLAALLATRGPAGAPSPLIARPAGDAVAMGSGVGAVVGRTPAGIDAISEEDAEGESGHVPSTPSAVRFTAPGWDTASASATTPSSGPLLGFFRAPDPFALRPPRDDVDFWAGPGMASVPEELPRGVPSADSPASSPVRSGAPSFFERLRTGAANFVSRVREHRVRPPPRPVSTAFAPLSFLLRASISFVPLLSSSPASICRIDSALRLPPHRHR